jgi:DNA-binding transcriptional LysR family regulator
LIEIYLLEQLDAVASCGTLSRAAVELNITQPALTRSIRKLEDAFGFPLFSHKGNRIEINEEGKLAAQYARRILQMEKEMIHHVTRQERSRRMIVIESCAPAPLTWLQHRLTANLPDIPIQSQMFADEEQIVRDLDNGSCRIAVLTHSLQKQGYSSHKLFSEHLNLTVMPAHPASAMKSVRFEMIDGETFLIQENLGIWEKLVRRCLPSSRFIQQRDPNDLATLRERSSLPAFSTDVAKKLYGSRPSKRIEIPISDECAVITFYAVYRTDDLPCKSLFP